MKETRFSANDRLKSILSSRKRTIVPKVSKGRYHDDRIEKIEKAVTDDISEILKIPSDNIKINYEEGPGYLVLVITVTENQ